MAAGDTVRYRGATDQPQVESYFFHAAGPGPGMRASCWGGSGRKGSIFMPGKDSPRRQSCLALFSSCCAARRGAQPIPAALLRATKLIPALRTYVCLQGPAARRPSILLNRNSPAALALLRIWGGRVAMAGRRPGTAAAARRARPPGPGALQGPKHKTVSTSFSP